MNRTDIITEGSQVLVRSTTGTTFRAVIEDYDEDIKNGRSGYDLDNNKWCYSDQIIRVIRRA